MSKMKKLVDIDKPSKIISVGDVVSHNLHEHNLHPQLSIIDNKFLRDQVMPKNCAAENTVHVRNPMGTITEEAVNAVKAALGKNEHVHIVVDGEEDLLVLIAVLYAPLNSLVVYGQPHMGLVAVKVTSRKRAEAKEFLKAMKPSKS
jgi:GTP-dependent dephospho-CoA kinase